MENVPVTTDLQAQIQALRAKDIVCLGTDEAFALRDSSGEIKAFKQKLELSSQNGGLIQPVPGGPNVISAQGYEKWAEAVGATTIFPKEVLVGNKWQANPCAERDPENRRILAIHARAISFRYTSKGLPQVSDWTTIFDLPSYRMIDLLGKAKKFPQAFRLLPAEMKPPQSETDTWAEYPFDESTKLWVNTSHKEALSWFSQILNREKKAMDFAQTFAKRNSLKHLSGLQKAPANVWNIPVLCWRPTGNNIIKWDATEYSKLQDRVTGMISGGNEEFEQLPQIEMTTGKENVSDEQGYDAMEQAIDPEDQAQVVEAEAPLSEEDQKIKSNFDVTKDSFPEEYKQGCSQLKINPSVAHSVDQMKAIMTKINEIIDSGAS